MEVFSRSIPAPPSLCRGSLPARLPAFLFDPRPGAVTPIASLSIRREIENPARVAPSIFFLPLRNQGPIVCSPWPISLLHCEAVLLQI